MEGGDMLAYLAALALPLEPTPAPVAPITPTTGDPTAGVTAIIPYVTGAGGALVVLLIVLWMFLNDKVTTVSAVTTLRDADNNRFNDMVAQRDSLVASLEKANVSLSIATKSAEQSLELLKDSLPEQRARRRTAAT